MARRLGWLLLASVLAVSGWLAWTLLAPLDPGRPKSVLLRPGLSARRIAADLKNHGVVRSQYAFLLAHYIEGGTLKAGEYRFEHPASALQVRKRLVAGDVYFHTVVIPEGFNLYDIAQAIGKAGLASPEEFIKAAHTDRFLISDLAPDAPSLEGYLFPDTYRFTRTQSVHDMLAAMVQSFRRTAAAIGLTSACAEKPQPALASAKDPPPCSLAAVVTMASVIEKETGTEEERPLIASVYYNRLQRGMALQADPSVIYAALVAGQYRGVIYQSNLQFNSPYNTYRHLGLPPGPIANPGRASLEAALHPARTDFLYFVSDNQGHHRFARTLEEHTRNVVAYRRALAGIR